MQTIMNDPYGMEKHILNLNFNTMSELIVSGTIEKMLDVESGTSKAGKEWKKQNFVINTHADFNPIICIGLFGDKIDMLKGKSVGDSVNVSINVSSREFDGKYYHNIDGWKIQSIKGTNGGDSNSKEEEDDLPF